MIILIHEQDKYSNKSNTFGSKMSENLFPINFNVTKICMQFEIPKLRRMNNAEQKFIRRKNIPIEKKAFN